MLNRIQQCVHVSISELYNKVGGERRMEQLSLDYMGAILKKERIAANFTQEELAENIGVTVAGQDF